MANPLTSEERDLERAVAEAYKAAAQSLRDNGFIDLPHTNDDQGEALLVALTNFAKVGRRP